MILIIHKNHYYWVGGPAKESPIRSQDSNSKEGPHVQNTHTHKLKMLNSNDAKPEAIRATV